MAEFIDITKKKEENKPTVFTHYLDSDSGWIETLDKLNTPQQHRIVYLGKCTEDGDMFAVYLKDNIILIYKGIKGNEFV